MFLVDTVATKFKRYLPPTVGSIFQTYIRQCVDACVVDKSETSTIHNQALHLLLLDAQ